MQTSRIVDLPALTCLSCLSGFRATDNFAQATTSLYKLRGLLQQAGGPAEVGSPAWARAMSAPDASWRVEEAKLLWAQGQQDTAVQLARSLLGARCGTHRGWTGGGVPSWGLGVHCFR